jgi:3-phosphoshikimate 1-carboxyvinyltransferase
MTTRREIQVPGDKSLSHRSLIFASLAEGRSRVRGILQSDDVESTAGVLRALGVNVPPLGDDITIDGVGLHGLRAPTHDLDCGNSGTTTRLMAGVLAASPFTSRMIGDDSLSKRPMRRVSKPLTAMGARIELENGEGLPMIVHGGDMRGIAWTSEIPSAQIKSAVLLAGLVGKVQVTYTEPVHSRDHTERMLAALGAHIETGERHDALGAPTGNTVWLHPSTRPLSALEVRVPGDPSSAAYFMALGAAHPGFEIRLPSVCLNPTRAGFLYVLRRMGADIRIEEEHEEGGEEVGTIVVRPAALSAADIDGREVPAMIDEVPLLACLATRAVGETIIRGAEELRVKESDRLAAVAANLLALGVRVQEQKDGLRVIGSDAPLRGRVHAFADHRIAMAFGVLGALPGNRIEIDDPSCVDISYPAFWRDLEGVTR